MSSCKWDREADDYMNDGEPCRRDEYGDPTRHCTARRTCSAHIGSDELTCPRCIGRTRATLRRIPTLAALMLPVAITRGVNSEAANLAGPSADPRSWTERRIAMRSHLAAWEITGRISEQQHMYARTTMEDDDEHHPLNVLGRWALMLAEDYAHDLPARLTVTNAAEYLDRQLSRIANDPEQDWALLVSEMRKCRQHLESALSVLAHIERGVPCPECTSEQTGVGPRLVRAFGHWCDDPDCERINYADDSADIWVCPRDRNHEWSHEDYTLRLEERKKATA